MDDAATAAGGVVSQGCAFVVEKVVARAYAENEVVEYMEALNEEEGWWVLHLHLGRAQADAVGTIAELGRIEVGALALKADRGTLFVDVAVEKSC
jgi:hypothetical protein